MFHYRQSLQTWPSLPDMTRQPGRLEWFDSVLTPAALLCTIVGSAFRQDQTSRFHIELREQGFEYHSSMPLNESSGRMVICTIRV